MKVLAIGDIHTKIWIINKVRQIAHDFDAIVFVGDYADDWGKAPIDTINTWKELRSFADSRKNVHLVQGNHDFIYTHNVGTSQGGYSTGTQFMLDMEPELKRWLRDLPIILELDRVTYSHAGITKDWSGGMHPDTLWNDVSPLWVRPDDGFEYKDMPQVFGHTPSETCWEVDRGIWCIDTFSTYPDGRPFGDGSVLEVVDGKQFIKRSLNDYYTINGIQGRLS